MENQLGWDYFFYNGENKISTSDQNNFDLMQGLLQPLKSMFFFRSEGAGLNECENLPNSIVLQILAKFNVIKWASFRNNYISNGRNGLPDRRIAVSQTAMSFEQVNGNVDINLPYINFCDYKAKQSIKIIG